MHRTLAPLVLMVTLAACGWTAQTAREGAALKSCDFARRCNQIGQGLVYSTTEECLTKQRATWLDAWPTAACDGKTDPAAVDTCLKAIDNTQCNNPLDWLATLSKCPASTVCK